MHVTITNPSTGRGAIERASAIFKDDAASWGLSAGPAVVLALLPVVVLIGPLVEELLFRGALLSVLRTRLGDGWAIAVSAILFGAVHLPDLGWLWYAVPNLVLIGVFCAWLRVRSGSIWPGFVAHAANNALATAGWFMAT